MSTRNCAGSTSMTYIVKYSTLVGSSLVVLLNSESAGNGSLSSESSPVLDVGSDCAMGVWLAWVPLLFCTDWSMLASASATRGSVMNDD